MRVMTRCEEWRYF